MKALLFLNSILFLCFLTFNSAIASQNLGKSTVLSKDLVFQKFEQNSVIKGKKSLDRSFLSASLYNKRNARGYNNRAGISKRRYNNSIRYNNRSRINYKKRRRIDHDFNDILKNTSHGSHYKKNITQQQQAILRYWIEKNNN